MIISASRRTDIPAFYPDWFINRIKTGYCAVPNPFNRNQVSYISLAPEDIDAIVFWTRNASPLQGYLSELDTRSIGYYFQFTVVDYPKPIDLNSPAWGKSIDAFRRLADQIGPERVVWRYDPIVVSDRTTADYHVERYADTARALKGYTRTSVISFLDVYKKNSKRIADLKKAGITVELSHSIPQKTVENLVMSIQAESISSGMELQSCAENFNLSGFGIKKGRCIDSELINELFRLDLSQKKDPGQREECGCVVSRDIGMYDSCLFGCSYCYATKSFDLARKNHSEHDPKSPSLLGWYDAEKPVQRKKKTKPPKQLKMF